MGDFNIDLLQFSNHTTDNIVNNTLSHSFIPVITRPTRLTFKSATIIDHIYTNYITSKTKSGIVDVADHFGTFYMKTNKYTENQAKYRTIRQHNEHNMSVFKNVIRQQDFTNIYTCSLDDVNIVYNICIHNLQKAHEEAFPQATIRI